jgi:hypothetical protein
LLSEGYAPAYRHSNHCKGGINKFRYRFHVFFPFEVGFIDCINCNPVRGRNQEPS